MERGLVASLQSKGASKCLVRLNHNATRCETHLLAQIRAASRASELNCSYSFDTKWMQRGNSSTPAFFRPRSKIRILGSGTPRLNLDFGYGYRIKSQFSVSERITCMSPWTFLQDMSGGVVAMIRPTTTMKVNSNGLKRVDVPCSCSNDSISLDGVPF